MYYLSIQKTVQSCLELAQYIMCLDNASYYPFVRQEIQDMCLEDVLNNLYLEDAVYSLPLEDAVSSLPLEDVLRMV